MHFLKSTLYPMYKISNKKGRSKTIWRPLQLPRGVINLILDLYIVNTTEDTFKLMNCSILRAKVKELWFRRHWSYNWCCKWAFRRVVISKNYRIKGLNLCRKEDWELTSSFYFMCNIMTQTISIFIEIMTTCKENCLN